LHDKVIYRNKKLHNDFNPFYQWVIKKLYNFDLNLISIKKMKKITLLIVLLFFGLQMNAQGVVINEIITSNAAVITDDD
jgi:hypothetical protein